VLSGESVLLRLPCWLGDLVQCEPAVRAVHARYREQGLEARVSLAGPSRLLAVLDGLFPAARRIPDERPERDWEGHGTALLFTSSFRSAWHAWRAGIPRRVGWSRDGRGLFLSHGWSPARERGALPLELGVRGRPPRFLPRPFTSDCVELVGLAGVAVRDPQPHLVPTEAERVAALEALAEGGVKAPPSGIILSVGCRAGSAKGWSAELWAQVADRLAERGVGPCLVVTGPGEEERGREVLRLVRDPEGLHLLDPAPGLRELVALSSLARVFVTTDSGPRHLAEAAGASTVVISGPTDPRHSSGCLDRSRLHRHPIACGPCHLEVCPRTGAEHHACMVGVQPAAVVASVLDLLE